MAISTSETRNTLLEPLCGVPAEPSEVSGIVCVVNWGFGIRQIASVSHVFGVPRQDIGHVGYNKRLALIKSLSCNSGYLKKRGVHIKS